MACTNTAEPSGRSTAWQLGVVPNPSGFFGLTGNNGWRFVAATGRTVLVGQTDDFFDLLPQTGRTIGAPGVTSRSVRVETSP